jgi:hypothetical protein
MLGGISGRRRPRQGVAGDEEALRLLHERLVPVGLGQLEEPALRGTPCPSWWNSAYGRLVPNRISSCSETRMALSLGLSEALEQVAGVDEDPRRVLAALGRLPRLGRVGEFLPAAGGTVALVGELLFLEAPQVEDDLVPQRSGVDGSVREPQQLPVELLVARDVEFEAHGLAPRFGQRLLGAGDVTRAGARDHVGIQLVE